jgi:hypothetical protein
MRVKGVCCTCRAKVIGSVSGWTRIGYRCHRENAQGCPHVPGAPDLDKSWFSARSKEATMVCTSSQSRRQRDDILERAPSAAFAANSYPGTSMNDLALVRGNNPRHVCTQYCPGRRMRSVFILLDRLHRVFDYDCAPRTGNCGYRQRQCPVII